MVVNLGGMGMFWFVRWLIILFKDEIFLLISVILLCVRCLKL